MIRTRRDHPFVSLQQNTAASSQLRPEVLAEGLPAVAICWRFDGVSMADAHALFAGDPFLPATPFSWQAVVKECSFRIPVRLGGFRPRFSNQLQASFDGSLTKFKFRGDLVYQKAVHSHHRDLTKLVIWELVQ